MGDSTTRSAERERRPEHDWIPDVRHDNARIVNGICIARARRFDAQLVHALVEEPTILAAAYGSKVAPYHFDAVALERAGLGKLDGDVQRCLAAERGEQRIGLLTIEDLFDSRCGYGFDVSTISQLGIGHDGGGIAVHENDAVALLAQHLARLRARVVELARLPDDDGTRPDDEDRADVSPFRHG